MTSFARCVPWGDDGRANQHYHSRRGRHHRRQRKRTEIVTAISRRGPIGGGRPVRHDLQEGGAGDRGAARCRSFEARRRQSAEEHRQSGDGPRRKSRHLRSHLGAAPVSGDPSSCISGCVRSARNFCGVGAEAKKLCARRREPIGCCPRHLVSTAVLTGPSSGGWHVFEPSTRDRGPPPSNCSCPHARRQQDRALGRSPGQGAAPVAQPMPPLDVRQQANPAETPTW